MAVLVKMRVWLAGVVFVAASGAAALAQTPAPAEAPPAVAAPAPAAAQALASAQGGMIHGTVVADTAGKPGGIPLPGVSVTATNSLSGKKYATTTDVTGEYAMAIPRNGRYVVKVELAAFAAQTVEVLLNKDSTNGGKPDQKADFGMELASRVAAAEARQTTTAASAARGVQSLDLNLGGDADTENASLGGAANDTSLPSLGGVADTAGAANDAYAVTGASGQTNGLAGFNEDEIRSRVEDAVAQARANGQLPSGAGDPSAAIVSMLGGLMGGRGPGGPGGRGDRGSGGGRGGRGGGGGGGNFRNFNPAQPHGNIFFQGGNSALNSAPWSPSLQPLTNPSAYSNRFGASIAGSPYIPGLTQPNTKQFVFVNLTGQKNLNAFLPNPARVPTASERAGDFSQSTIGAGAAASRVQLYDPATGAPIPGNNLANATAPISPQALALLNYYPAPNIPLNAQGYNYQTISNAGSNNVAINSRYMRQLGGAAGGGPFGGFGGGGRRGGGGNANTKPTLRQNINIGYNYSHAASDQRNIFLPLGGANESDGHGLNVGYTIGYGRLSNNASVNWNRSNAETRNYFTDTANNPSATVGLNVPNQTGGFADPRFYNGLASVGISNFAGISNTTPSQTINQTISFSDFVSWRHAKHNYRFGLDVRRVHADSIGGNNPLGSFTFTGYATASPADQVKSAAGQVGASGDAFADFLLGLPQSTSLQAGLHKIYLRENVYDAYAQDDWRVLANVTLNYSVRYEYFAPYTEKNNRLVNLTHDAAFSAASIQPVLPGAPGLPSSLVKPDRTMFAPRFGFAWSPKVAPKLTKSMVVRGGYGINYNTGQFANFARSLSHQSPFANTQTNNFPTYTLATLPAAAPAPTGCTTTQTQYTYTNLAGQTVVRPATTANLTLTPTAATGGFGCSTGLTIGNNFAVDPNYRLGMVQIYNLNIQKTVPLNIVLNVGYTGSRGSNLDVVGSPNATPSGVATPGIAAFDYEESAAGSRSNALVVSAQKRQVKGIALGAIYTYSHTITNASGVGGASGTPVQNFYRLDLEEGNASFDQRHKLTGTWVTELPFGPNRAYLNKGGLWSHVLDGFSLSGDFTFGSGRYYTPHYSGNQTSAASGDTFTPRPDRVIGQPLKGPGTVKQFFNIAAFTAPAAGQYGTASPGSIEGPGTVSTNASLSRTVQLGDARSFEARVTATNVFNTVQYSGIDTTENSANFGEVTSAANMRALQVQARYRF
ncbi:MAG TPA: TonB-dependent receptor [Acidobacteriaceae bacterium]